MSKLADIHDLVPEEFLKPYDDVTYMFKTDYHRINIQNLRWKIPASAEQQYCEKNSSNENSPNYRELLDQPSVRSRRDDNKLYYWNTYLAEPEWTIYTQWKKT